MFAIQLQPTSRSMIIKNYPTNNYQQLKQAVENGGKFVRFHYCYGAVVGLYSDSTDIFYVSSFQHALKIGLRYTLPTLLFGWWFFPTGPIYTIRSLIKNLRGGEDMTGLVLEEAQQGDPGFLAGLY